MAFPKYSFIEILLFVIFVAYLIFPIKTPFFLASMVDSTFGIIGIFIVIIYLFFYANPILAILYIFVAYELVRRSSEITGRVSIIQYTPSQAIMNVETTFKPVAEYIHGGSPVSF